MHLVPSSRLLVLTIAIYSLTASAVRFGKAPQGINCEGSGCGWDCTGGCANTFAQTIDGIADDAVLHDGQRLACMFDIMSGDGMCATIYGLGTATTTGANIKLVAQDLANHCGACGSAPVNRNDGNKLKGGWLEIEAVGQSAIQACNSSPDNQFILCENDTISG